MSYIAKITEQGIKEFRKQYNSIVINGYYHHIGDELAKLEWEAQTNCYAYSSLPNKSWEHSLMRVSIEIHSRWTNSHNPEYIYIDIEHFTITYEADE